MSAQIWTSLVQLTEPLTDITTPVTLLPPGSPILHNMSLKTYATSLEFLEAFMLNLTTDWKSQDSVLKSYNATTASLSTEHYTMKYFTVDKCTRFSTFVEQEIDKATPWTVESSQDARRNVIPEKLTTAFLTALQNALISASVPTEAGLLFWTQFSSANIDDKVTLIIDDIIVEANANMKPKCTADDVEPYTAHTGYFGVEIKCIAPDF
jgi:hypothetical protein